MLYTIKKVGCMYHVLTQSGVIQFRSMVRKNCSEWIAFNTQPQETAG
jgi:hypothetical protein